MNKPSDEINPAVFSAIFVIGIIVVRSCDPKYVIIFGVIAGLIMFIYTIKSIIKHEAQTKIIIYFVSVLMTIAIIIMYYFKLTGVNLNIFGIVLPLLLMLLMFAMYVRIKRMGNKKNIKQAKVILIFEIILMTLVILFFSYMLFFR